VAQEDIDPHLAPLMTQLSQTDHPPDLVVPEDYNPRNWDYLNKPQEQWTPEDYAKEEAFRAMRQRHYQQLDSGQIPDNWQELVRLPEGSIVDKFMLSPKELRGLGTLNEGEQPSEKNPRGPK
jgi:hypothetical protein